MRYTYNAMENNTAVLLSREIRRLRSLRGMDTTAALAKAAGVKRSWLSRVENADIPGPSPILLQKVAGALGVPPSQLWGIIGYQSRNLLHEHPEDFLPEVVDTALSLQSLPAAYRQEVLDAVRATLRVAEAAARYQTTPLRALSDIHHSEAPTYPLHPPAAGGKPHRTYRAEVSEEEVDPETLKRNTQIMEDVAERTFDEGDRTREA